MNRDELRALSLVSAISLGLGSAATYGQTGSQEGSSITPNQQAAGQDQGQRDSMDRNDASGASGDETSLDELISQHDNLSTFVEALRAAGMADAITGGTQYTVFAPTDEAFEDRREELLDPANREELIQTLRAHIVADDLDSEMARNLGQAQTIDGGTVDLQIEDEEMQVDDATVVDADIEVGSLRVYAIDGVLEPDDDAEQVAGNGSSPDRNTGGTGSYPSFEDVDSDADGELDLIEVAMIEGDVDFTDLDANQDGSVSRAEYQQATQR